MKSWPQYYILNALQSTNYKLIVLFLMKLRARTIKIFLVSSFCFSNK